MAQPPSVVCLGDDTEWDRLVRLFGSRKSASFQRCLEAAVESGAKWVVVEPDYIDLDFRSEFSAFYSKTFEPPPSVSTRLHFFGLEPAHDALWELDAAVADSYVGYACIRPPVLGRVGRTMLAPSPRLRPFVRTAVEEQVHFFGQDLRVSGVPFVEQDLQVGRCAHAAAWVCHYTAFRRGDVARQPMGAFAQAAVASLAMTRQLPSGGLNPQQIQELLRQFGMPTLVHVRGRLPPTTRSALAGGPALPARDSDDLERLACRILDSGMPIIVATQRHAFAVCGYRRDPLGGALRFIHQDDQRGPYFEPDPSAGGPDADVLVDAWQSVLVPLPEKVWLAGETAEVRGAQIMLALDVQGAKGAPTAGKVTEGYRASRVDFRTYLRPSSAFKRELAGRVPAPLLGAYRMTRLPRFVWVVEAVDTALRDAGQEECVLGEVVLDATSSDHRPVALIQHVLEWARVPDDRPPEQRAEELARLDEKVRAARGGEAEPPTEGDQPLEDGVRAVACPRDPYRSGGVGPP